MRIIGASPTKNVRVKAIPGPGPRVTSDLIANSSSMFLNRFYQFWDLMDTIRIHGYLRTAMSVIGRSAVGTGWSLVEHPEYPRSATERKRRKLFRFYTSPFKEFNNIQDYFSSAQKIMIGIMYLRYFGRAAYKVLRDDNGVAVGWDFLYGFVVPNVDSNGRFKKEAAFVQFLSNDLRDTVFHKNPRDIVYIVNPDWEGFPGGGSDIESLTTFSLPLDIYLQTIARQYVKNRDKPEVIYSIPAEASQDAFDTFAAQVQQKWAGPSNAGKGPIVVAGEVDIKELERLPKGLPYQEARSSTIKETQAVSGVNSGKMGDPGPSAALRELRREFHETTMVPLFKIMEVGFYEQVHVREFSAEGWTLEFNSPDFLTAVERATVDMRYTAMGVLNPNEIRAALGKQPRDDELGDAYVDHTATRIGRNNNGQGSPPEGRPINPDDPAQVGEPTDDDQDPERGDNHDDDVRLMISEARKWRQFAVKRLGKDSRNFRPETISPEVSSIVQDSLDQATTREEIDAVFDQFIEILCEETEYEYA